MSTKEASSGSPVPIVVGLALITIGAFLGEHIGPAADRILPVLVALASEHGWSPQVLAIISVTVRELLPLAALGVGLLLVPRSESPEWVRTSLSVLLVMGYVALSRSTFDVRTSLPAPAASLYLTIERAALIAILGAVAIEALRRRIVATRSAGRPA